jgi:hypothetical protein
LFKSYKYIDDWRHSRGIDQNKNIDTYAVHLADVCIFIRQSYSFVRNVMRYEISGFHGQPLQFSGVFILVTASGSGALKLVAECSSET